MVRFTYDYPTEDIATALIISRDTYPANTPEKVTSMDEDDGRRGLTIEYNLLNLPSEGTTLYSFYAHLSETDVEVGQEVKEGDTIGKTGTTGNAKTMVGKDQHLHFELRTGIRLGKGTAGRRNPNDIVTTKFTSQDPTKSPQMLVGVIREDEDENKIFMDID